MAIVQLIAARFADIDSVVYHSIDAEGREAFEAARAQAEAISGGATLDHIVDALHMQGFVWGRPDGN